MLLNIYFRLVKNLPTTNGDQINNHKDGWGISDTG